MKRNRNRNRDRMKKKSEEKRRRRRVPTSTSCKEEKRSEDWCFDCKDGGTLRVCDYKDCPKAYHPDCVEKGDSFLESKQDWSCKWHSCYLPECRRASKFKCYCCPISVCRHCIKTADFVPVERKRKMGFCGDCLKLALLVEENKDVDSDGDVLDFKSRETYEGLFKEYWEIINETEGLTVEDLISANTRYRRNYISDGSENEEVIKILSDSDDLDTAVEAKMPKMRTKRSKHRVDDNMGAHYAKKKAHSGYEEISFSSEDKDDNVNVDCKRRKKSTTDRISRKEETDHESEETDHESPRYKFAAIVHKNIKLIYLKRSLVKNLSEESDTFESKVTGSFVRIKLDPKRNSYQLGQVTGITKHPVGGNNQEIRLQIANISSDISISELSEIDFSKEECLDLKNKVKCGLLKRLTVKELEQKARSLQVDIMTHWIPREIEKLDRLANHANIIGQRAVYRTRFECLELKQILQDPMVQSRLLQKDLNVIPDMGDFEDDKEGDEESLKSILKGVSVIPVSKLSDISTKKSDTTCKIKGIVSLSEAERSYKGKTGEVISVNEEKETEKGGESQPGKVLVKLEKSTSVARMSSASYSTRSESVFSATELDNYINSVCKTTEGNPPAAFTTKKVVEFPEKATGFDSKGKSLTDKTYSDLKAEMEMLKIKLEEAKRTTRKEMRKACKAEKRVEDLETKMKEMEEAKKKDIEEILKKTKEEEALKMSQMEEAHLKELEDVKISYMKAAAITMLETKIGMMEDFSKGLHTAWDLNKEYNKLSLLSGETAEAGEVNSGVNEEEVSNPAEEAKV